MHKRTTRLFKVAKKPSTYWIALGISTVLIVIFYHYLRSSLFHTPF